MARKIVGAVRLKGGLVLKEGQERNLSDLELPQETLKRLEDKGVLRGFSSTRGEAQEDENGMPTIRELRDYISDMNAEDIEEMMRGDDRVSAREIYEARLNELQKDNE